MHQTQTSSLSVDLATLFNSNTATAGARMPDFQTPCVEFIRLYFDTHDIISFKYGKNVSYIASQSNGLYENTQLQKSSIEIFKK